MKPLKATDFPALQRVFSNYLHQDFLDEHGTPAAALRRFLDHADSAERLRFRTEARRLVEEAARLTLKDVRALIARLGCRWVPPSRKALMAVLVETTTPLADRHDP